LSNGIGPLKGKYATDSRESDKISPKILPQDLAPTTDSVQAGEVDKFGRKFYFLRVNEKKNLPGSGYFSVRFHGFHSPKHSFLKGLASLQKHSVSSSKCAG
jgi:hypothetical protein